MDPSIVASLRAGDSDRVDNVAATNFSRLEPESGAHPKRCGEPPFFPWRPRTRSERETGRYPLAHLLGRFPYQIGLHKGPPIYDVHAGKDELLCDPSACRVGFT